MPCRPGLPIIRGSLFALALLVAWAPPATGQDVGATPAGDATQALVKQYCVGCHNDRLKRGDLVLSGLDAARPTADVATWEKVARKVRAGMMPPAGAKRPDKPQLEAFASGLEAAIDRAAAAAPNPGRPALHRLNRVEYSNSVRDLLGFEIDAASLLPPDDMSHGFDNVAASLTLSPTLMESYIAAANVITRLATGDPDASPRVATYRVPQTVNQNDHVEGAPLGTRGGVAVRHYFPADGEYAFGMSFYHYNGKMFGALQEREQIEVSIDGVRVALLDINLRMGATDEVRTPPIKIKAGSRLVSAAFIRRAAGPVQDFIQPFENALSNLAAEVPGVTGLLHVLSLGITGPTNVTGLGDTPSRRQIFSCRPAGPRDEEACAQTILSRLARQAFRRPVDSADVARLMRLYRDGRTARGNFEAGVRMGLQGILADPEFLFRFERTPAGVAPGSPYRISDLELASRLSFFLWSSSPDEALIQLASRGKLKDPVVLEQQVQRMLADPKADALAENFASQWLHLRNLRDWHPDPFIFPDADRNLMRSMERETELLFMSIVREDRPILDLLTADYTFVDGRLARHYGIPNVVGNRFRRVPVADESRRGLLGHASILTVTALPTRTSPVVRGKWILDNLLGAPPPQPPPDVPPLAENTEDTKPVPLRARLQAHRASPTCAACHAVMDPIGFALEGFDAVGRTREFDSGERIDPSGQLMDGTNLDGPLGLRKALLERSDLFARTFTEKLLTYALGRGLSYSDMPVTRSIVKSADQRGGRFSAVVLAVVNSVPFQMRTTEPPAPTDGGNGH
jgi:mono/diheme cytochrome c family protein